MSIEKKIGQNLGAIQQRIGAAARRADRDPAEITLVAVTKSVGVDEIVALRDAGITHFGENRVEAARDKIREMNDPSLVWHMVGNVQRRKAKEVLALFDSIDAVDRIALAETLQRRCEEADIRCRVLVEINVSGENQKHGIAPDDFEESMEQLASLDRVRVDGLLTMAPYGADREVLLDIFQRLRHLAELKSLPALSMGMSGDFETAIEAGATQVRIGRALFE